MKKLLLILFICISFVSYSQHTSTIYFINKKCKFNVSIYLNDQLIGTLARGENLEYKFFSEGRLVLKFFDGVSGHGLTILDVVKDSTYYYVYNNMESSIYGEMVDKKEGLDLLYKNHKTIREEESKRNPLIEPNEEEYEAKQGTCFVINNQGYLLTNYHVISGAKKILIKGIGGNFSSPQEADVIAFDIDLDLALLKLHNQSIHFDSIPYGNCLESNQQARQTFVLGYPLANSMGNEIKISEGIISANSGYKGSISQYQFSAPVQPGNSGSPLFNDKGELLGIINAKLSGAEGAGYAIKSHYISAFLKLIEGVQVANSRIMLSNMTLSEKVAKLKNYVFIIVTE